MSARLMSCFTLLIDWSLKLLGIGEMIWVGVIVDQVIEDLFVKA